MTYLSLFIETQVSLDCHIGPRAQVVRSSARMPSNILGSLGFRDMEIAEKIEIWAQRHLDMPQVAEFDIGGLVTRDRF